MTVEERFWFHVDKSAGPEACWIWKGSTKSSGYGSFAYPWNRMNPAHRFAFELEHGVRVPRTHVVMHKCDNPPCVNPAHLEVGTHSENFEDMRRKERGYRQRNWQRKTG